MTPEVEARFQRIEASLERAATRIDSITEAHLELEAAQLNTEKSLNKLSEKTHSLGERLENMAILVDRLIERDLGRPNGP